MDELGQLDIRIKESNMNFLRAVDEYETRGGTLEARSEVIAIRYIEDEPPRAAPIIQSAEDILRNIHNFSRLRANIMSDVAFVVLAHKGLVSALQFSIVSDAVSKVTSHLDSLLKEPRDTPKTLNLDRNIYVAEAELAASLLIDSMEIVAPIYLLRLNGISNFVGDNEKFGVIEYIDAIIKVARRKGPLEFIKQILSTAAPGSQLLFEAYEIMGEIKAELLRRELVYSGRNDVDHLLEFAAWLSQQESAIADIHKVLEKNQEALTASADSLLRSREQS